MLSRGQAVLFGMVGVLVVGAYFAFQNSYSEDRVTIADLFEQEECHGEECEAAGPGGGGIGIPGLPGFPDAPEPEQQNITNETEERPVLDGGGGGGGGEPYKPPPVEEIENDPMGFDCSEALVGYCDAWNHGFYNPNNLPFGNQTFLEVNPQCEDHPFFEQFGQPSPQDCDNLYLNQTTNGTS